MSKEAASAAPAALEVDPASLPRDPDVLIPLILQLLQELRQRDGRVEDLEQRMDLLLKRLYGRTSEKLDPRQQSLFDLAAEESAGQAPLAPTPPPSTSASPAKPAEKGRHGRRRLPDRLRRVERVHDLTPAEKELLGGEANLLLIGREVTEQLEWEPSSLYVIRHVQLTYARRDPLVESGPTLEEQNVVTAAKPPQPLAGGLAGPGLLAHVATAKYVDHVPLHRQERQFARHGLVLPRQTTCDWVLEGAEFLSPLYDLAVRLTLQSAVLHLDATSVKIRDATRGIKRTGYFWPCVGDETHPLVAFHYTDTHTRDGPAELLKNFRGHLQVDAHSVYDGLFGDDRIIEVGCWMHARRGFFEARAVDRLRAETALAYIAQLYAVERDLQERCVGPWCEKPAAERYALIAAERQERSRPTLEALFAWIEAEAPKLTPKNPVRQAMDYARRHQAALVRYAADGRLAIDNGTAERAIRGIALGRRNWLFCGSQRGARAACVYFTLAASCRRHAIDPFAYLRDVFTRLPKLLAESGGPLGDAQLRDLLPDRWRPASN